MVAQRSVASWTARRKLAIGTVALLLGAWFVFTLATIGVTRAPLAMGMGVASVGLLVVATLSIGTSSQTRV